MKKIIKIVLKILPYLIVSLPWIYYYRLRKNKISRIKKYHKIRTFLNKVSKLLSMEYEIEGKENLPVEESYLICPNHQSLVDPFIFINVFNDPISFVSKEEVKKMPIIRTFVSLLDGYYLERDNLKQEIKTMKAIQKEMDEKNVRYVVFPEGTRTKDPSLKMNPFKPGAFKFTMNSSKKIVPVCIYGTRDVFDKKVNKKKYKIKVKFYPPVDKNYYEGKTTIEVASFVQNQIKEGLDEFCKQN
ncbi:MAG: lysophospholipid acyltransferase family protein [Bacilli bacterium]|nr:lysophospholipid acyltransferase family protein [Bacillales bacterium]MDY2574486.1 lysophospholipid acyltransferase family protein [Bacilli bacterium]